MTTFDANEINDSSWRLWERTFKDSNLDVLVPLHYPPTKKDCLLFLGLNPSFSERGFSSLLRTTKYPNIDPRQFYSWSNRQRFDPTVDEYLDSVFKEQYPYFSKFKNISKHAGEPWEYADLFFYRCTNQKEFKTIIKDSKGKLTEFAIQQLTLSRQLIEKIEPKIIVVANALASRIYFEQFSPIYNDDNGYHISIINHKNVPTFLASMFTGQRAMDIYSFQRLKSHIRKVVLTLKK